MIWILSYLTLFLAFLDHLDIQINVFNRNSCLPPYWTQTSYCRLSLLYSPHLIGVRRRATDNNNPASSNWHITDPYRQPLTCLVQLTDNHHVTPSNRQCTHTLQTTINLSQVTDRVHTLPMNNYQPVSCNWHTTAIPLQDTEYTHSLQKTDILPHVADKLHTPCRQSLTCLM